MVSNKEVRLSPALSSLLKAAFRGRTEFTKEELYKVIFCVKHGKEGELVSVCEEDGARLYKCGCEYPPQDV